MSDFENERDEQLISEWEESEKESEKMLAKQIEDYENSFLDNIIENMIDSEDFDKLMIERLEYINDHFDFEPSPEFEQLEEFYYQDYESKFQDENRLPSDYYYPEGPDGESIEGFDYPEGYNDSDNPMFYQQTPQYEEPFYDADIDFPEPEMEPPEYVIKQDEYYDYLIETAYEEYGEYNQEDYMQDLIKQHLKEEEDFTAMVQELVQEEYIDYPTIDEAIFDYIDIEYDRDDFDYDETPTYWYDKPDPCVKEPFESFNEIDYPEGNVETGYVPPHEYDFDLEEDYRKFKLEQKKKLVNEYPDDEIPEPPEVIAFTDEEREKLKSRIKEHFKKNESLDKLIKEKISEKKFK